MRRMVVVVLTLVLMAALYYVPVKYAAFLFDVFRGLNESARLI